MHSILKKIVIALVSVIVLLSAAVYFLPATWVAYIVAKQTNQHLLFANAKGRMMAGSAHLNLSNGVNGYPLSTIYWQWLWQDAFSGKITLKIKARILAEPLLLSISSQGLSLSKNRIKLPLVALSSLGAPLNTLNLKGSASLQWSRWHSTSQGGSGSAVLEVENTRSYLSRDQVMGHYRAQITNSVSGLRFTLQTLEGPLFINGSGSFSNRLRFSAKANTTQEKRAVFRPLLTLIGKREGNHIRISIP